MKKILIILILAFSYVLSFSFMVQPLIQTIEANPGDEVEIEFIITNTTKKTENLKIIANGVYINPKESNWVIDDSYERSFKDWISYTENLELFPDEKRIEKFKVNVPFNAAGSYFVAFNYTSKDPIQSGQIAYKMNFISIVQLIVNGQGNRTKLSISSATPTIIKENNEFKGVKVEYELSNESDWLASTWGRIDIKSNELKKIPASLNIEQNDGVFLSPKKTKIVTYEIKKIIPPGNYVLQFILDYGFQEYYKGKLTYEVPFEIPAEVEANRKEIFIGIDKKIIVSNIQKRESSRGLQVTPDNQKVILFNNDYIDANVSQEINNNFSPEGALENFDRFIDLNFVKLRSTRDIRARAYSSSGFPVNVSVDYRRAELEKLTGEYYGNLLLKASGDLKNRTLTKDINIPIIVNFGDNTYNLEIEKNQYVLDDKTFKMNYIIKNTGNSRVPFDLNIFMFNSETNEVIGEEISAENNYYVYPNCEINRVFNMDIEENVDKIIAKFKIVTSIDEDGNKVYQEKSYEYNLK